MYRVLSKAKWHAVQMDKPRTRQDRREDPTEGRRVGRKEAAIMHTEGKDSRSGEREGRKKGGKKRRGQMKQENPAQS